MKHIIAGALAIISLIGCATVERDGFKLKQSAVDESFTAVTNRASFEFPCPKEQLKLVVINVSTIDSAFPSQIGASGCGHKAVYVTSRAGWVMNSDGEGPKAQ